MSAEPAYQVIFKNFKEDLDLEEKQNANSYVAQ